VPGVHHATEGGIIAVVVVLITDGIIGHIDQDLDHIQGHAQGPIQDQDILIVDIQGLGHIADLVHEILGHAQEARVQTENIGPEAILNQNHLMEDTVK
jgi:hypothetical protein